MNDLGRGPLPRSRGDTAGSIAGHPEIMRENRLVMGLYGDPRADIFRRLRANVLKQLRDNRWNSLAITSAKPGAGKSFTAANLAVAMALEGNQKVLAVDADLRRPRLSDYFDARVETGLIDYLRGTVELEKTLVNPGFEGLVILPGRDCGEDLSHCSEWLSSPAMANLVRVCKSSQETRVVIFDIPPLCIADDALSFLPYVDGVLLVVEDGETTGEDLRHSLQLLEQTNLLGLVLNKSRQPAPSHLYGYGDGYGSKI